MIGSCGKRKATQSPDAPGCKDLLSKEALAIWQKRLGSLTVMARDMYTGNQSRELTVGVDRLRTITGVTVDLFIISAGFGLLAEDTLVPPYECSFSGMKKGDLLSRAETLAIPEDFRDVCRTDYELMYLALGKDYLLSLGSGWYTHVSCPVIMFDDQYVFKNRIFLPSGNDIVRELAESGYKIHGAAGFKGDLLRILADNLLSMNDPAEEAQRWTDHAYLRGLMHRLLSSHKGYEQTKLT